MWQGPVPGKPSVGPHDRTGFVSDASSKAACLCLLVLRLGSGRCGVFEELSLPSQRAGASSEVDKNVLPLAFLRHLAFHYCTSLLSQPASNISSACFSECGPGPSTTRGTGGLVKGSALTCPPPPAELGSASNKIPGDSFSAAPN